MDGKARMGKREREKGVGKREWERLFFSHSCNGKKREREMIIIPDGNFPFFPVLQYGLDGKSGTEREKPGMGKFIFHETGKVHFSRNGNGKDHFPVPVHAYKIPLAQFPSLYGAISLRTTIMQAKLKSHFVDG